jgi:hypothetical protein
MRRVAISSGEGRTLLLDPGFPLPCLVPLDRPEEEIPTGYGKVAARVQGAAVQLTLEARGRTVEICRIRTGEDPPPAKRASSWHRVFEGERFRLEGDRLLRWRRGRMDVTDAWSRLSHPLGGGEKEILEALFRVPCGDLAGILPDGAPVHLAVFDFSPLPRALLESRRGRFPGTGDGGLSGAGEGAPFRSRRWDFEEMDGGTRVKLTAGLADVPPRGPTEALRKTLVFLLASEVLDLSRD